jgi:hypothetical protein
MQVPGLTETKVRPRQRAPLPNAEPGRAAQTTVHDGSSSASRNRRTWGACRRLTRESALRIEPSSLQRARITRERGMPLVYAPTRPPRSRAVSGGSRRLPLADSATGICESSTTPASGGCMVACSACSAAWRHRNAVLIWISSRSAAVRNVAHSCMRRRYSGHAPRLCLRASGVPVSPVNVRRHVLHRYRCRPSGRPQRSTLRESQRGQVSSCCASTPDDMPDSWART